MTKEIIKISRRKFAKNLRRNLFLMSVILFSAVLLSFFTVFSVRISDAVGNDMLPIEHFIKEMKEYIKNASIVLLLFTFIIIRIHCSVRREENLQTIAVLQSIGATSKHISELVIFETTVLYITPMFIGICIGSMAGSLFASDFISIWSDSFVHKPQIIMLLAFAEFIVCVIMTFICNIKIEFRRRCKRKSIIAAIKQSDKKETDEPHVYRNSETFRNMFVLKRLAKKNVDFHKKGYNRISISLALSVLYPVIGWLLIFAIGSEQVIIDLNPYDRINTTEAVLSVVDSLLLFLILSFFVLTVLGILQSAFMIRTHVLKRRSMIPVYKSIGISERDCKSMFFKEIKSCFAKSFVYIVFVTAMLIMIFQRVS